LDFNEFSSFKERQQHCERAFGIDIGLRKIASTQNNSSLVLRQGNDILVEIQEANSDSLVETGSIARYAGTRGDNNLPPRVCMIYTPALMQPAYRTDH
jgi:hypothetical protein